MQVEERLSYPSGLIEGVCSLSGEPVVLDGWQRELMDTEDGYVIWRKARQVGWSFAVAGRGWARCYLSGVGKYSMILVSYNLDDAREKMRFVNMFDEGLPDGERLGRIVDNKFEVEFSNRNRIVAQFMPRGKGNAEVAVDEMAYIQDARNVYRATLPVTSRGGRVLAGSSVLAQSGMYHDVWSGAEGKFGKFRRVTIFWWNSSALCTDVGRAVAEAPEMGTGERVERFGTENLKDIFDNMFLEDFQQEYECRFCDESSSFISYALIDKCSPTGDSALKICKTSEELYECTGDLYGGMDVGLRRDATVFTVAEYNEKTGRVEGRYKKTLERRGFEEQESYLYRLLDLPQMKRFGIDQNGIGEQLTERARREYGSKVVGIIPSPKLKPRLATNVRSMMERGEFYLPADREIRQQFHSVKRVVTAHGNLIYDVERNEKHHADIFWSYALALWAFHEMKNKNRPFLAVVHGRDPGERSGVIVKENN